MVVWVIAERQLAVQAGRVVALDLTEEELARLVEKGAVSVLEEDVIEEAGDGESGADGTDDQS